MRRDYNDLVKKLFEMLEQFDQFQRTSPWTP